MTASPPRHPLGWLERQPEFRSVADRASQLLALQADLRSCAQARTLTALGLEGDTLLVGTAGAAAAAKLRQVAPTIVAHLASRGWRVAQVRFRPMPAGSVAPAPVPQERAPIPERALSDLRALADQSSSPALKEAIAGLLGRRDRR